MDNRNGVEHISGSYHSGPREFSADGCPTLPDGVEVLGFHWKPKDKAVDRQRKHTRFEIRLEFSGDDGIEKARRALHDIYLKVVDSVSHHGEVSVANNGLSGNVRISVSSHDELDGNVISNQIGAALSELSSGGNASFDRPLLRDILGYDDRVV